MSVGSREERRGSFNQRRVDRGGSDVAERKLPWSEEAEKAVLGSILLLPSVLDDVAPLLRADDFHDDANRKIYEQILHIYDGGKRIDPMLVAEQLKKVEQYDVIGGAAYLAEVAQSVPTAANAVYYAEILRDRATLRSLILSGTEIVRDAYDPELSAREMLNKAEERIFSIHDKRTNSNVKKIDDVLMEAFKQIDARMEKGGSTGLSTGFADLDHLTGGLHPSELMIVAARPAMGKTAFALNIAENIATRKDAAEGSNVTLFVSLEMSHLELVQRVLCSRGEIAGEKFRSGFLSKDDRQKLIEVSSDLSRAPLYIDDSPTRTVTEIAAAARRIKRQVGLGLIVVDYLQLLQPDDPRDPRQEQVAKMARRLKVVARELKVPIICLAQLNRQAEMTKDNRPKLSHLRESGAIEQDADVVVMVHREEYYLSQAEREAIRAEGDPNGILGQADIIIAKQRSGPTGEAKLHWFQQFTRFKNAEQRQYDEFEQYASDDF